MTTEVNPQAAVAPAAPPKNNNRRKALTILLAVIVIAAIAWTAYYMLVLRWHQDTDDAYVQGNVVNITPQVTGTVVSIGADDGMKVNAGQVLVQLDPNDAQVAYDQATANLANTVRQVRGLFSAVDAGQADLSAREVAVQKARADVKRREGLVASGAVSAEELAHARDELASAEAAMSSSRGSLARNRALVDATTVAKQPQVAAAAAQLRQAYLNLQRSAIVAPVSGYVGKRNVQLGQRVQPGAALMTIIPLDQVWVEANFKETQLAKMRIGQSVDVHSDLYGGDVTYQGKVVSLGMGTGSAFSLLPAQNASGNWIKIIQRVPVRIEIEPKQLVEHPLRLGLSMHVDVGIREQTGAVLAAAPPAKPVLVTDAYAKQLHEADAMIEKIVRDNLPGMQHG
ncbi:efflux RND transporter periplasmic adaptor subunit [Lysobacter capsici]|jgi:membrane fusion protein (multidrug efflux system)|uniref:Membrane fusion component of tripartite multidrug resistance system n=1 Tax=Lysobacter capsici AZ78 TaxID=1444315 RepID=A0A108U6S7_9GAMM|nr:efflux RND transporter periplasmic adaptor subunit [Lysobacter capsici]ATE71427.1 EmrA/EmrK family multidrug efflux transporter periplasmic adaptor subunit [Lysobacter capsici]KWS03584.1 Membrane fusion component of tripartite multidrug resistance system [Lysobacter capsici AZ78]UOF16732.1 efflux RND transporter periplasmic adaptor subunit [Lysobacter capsici]WND82429.1 efflux RND transporter periplasmic adaptor subunit [Lysobacter capsici]WND87625.1 efflux RND transporter periplasmic adapt